MPEFRYPTVGEALAMHRALIDEFGGIHSLRDRGLLEAAIFRPQNGYYEDLIHEAAALMESLANNHPFLDGNKRLSLAATDVFLRLNGMFLDLETHSAHRHITQSIADREFRVTQIRQWLAKNTKSLSQERS